MKPIEVTEFLEIVTIPLALCNKPHAQTLMC